MAEVTVIGNTVADLSFGLPRHYLRRAGIKQAIELPFGSKLEATQYELTPGGSGANVAVGLHRGGVNAQFLSSVGDDFFGRYLTSELEQTGLKTHLQSFSDSTNLSAIFRIGEERTIVTAHNDNYNYLPTDLPSTGWLHLGPLAPAADSWFGHLLTHLTKTSQPVSLNPDIATLQERPRYFSLLLRVAEIIILNQEEAIAMTRLATTTPPAELALAIGRMGPKVACVTCGVKGAYVSSENKLWFAPTAAEKSERVDTTGAGDAFTAGFLLGYLDKLATPISSIEWALKWAMVEAASVVGAVGGQTGLMAREQIIEDAEAAVVRKVER